MTAAAGTVFIAAGAFWLSFTALADLAARSGIGQGQAWAWPLIVDGIIVVATVAVVALAGDRAAWYPWGLLVGGALVSVTANALHAIVAADASVPNVLAAAVAAVPPAVLLAITHLTVILARPTPGSEPELIDNVPPLAEIAPARASELTRIAESAMPQLGAVAADEPKKQRSPAPTSETGVLRRAEAIELRARGLSNKQIARRLGVHPSTVGRWFAHLSGNTDQPMPESEGVPS